MADLAQHADELKWLGLHVLVVSFCPDAQTAQRWDEEVGSPFLHLIDPSLEVPGHAGRAYQTWGFRKSFQGVWSPEALRFYSDETLKGHQLHPSHGQDVHQMGGDVLLDQQGVVVFRHYSQTSQDRPSVEQLLVEARSLVRPCWPLNLAALYAAAVTTAETLRVRLICAVQGMVAWVPVWTRKSLKNDEPCKT